MYDGNTIPTGFFWQFALNAIFAGTGSATYYWETTVYYTHESRLKLDTIKQFLA